MVVNRERMMRLCASSVVVNRSDIAFNTSTQPEHEELWGRIVGYGKLGVSSIPNSSAPDLVLGMSRNRQCILNLCETRHMVEH
jgi:hypothetical protein